MVPLAVLVIATSTTAALAWSRAPSGGATSADAPPWPASIAPIAAFVSRDRGLKFLHPVPVVFQSPSTFDRETASDDQPVNAAQRADVARQAAQLRSLGLIGGSVNLVKAQTAVDTGGVLAYYDDDKRDIVIRGTKLTPDTKVTLSHELTHVLQDQHFDLHKLDGEATTNDQQFATTAIEEGDAVLTENDYQDALPKSQQREAAAEEDAQSGPSVGSVSGRGPTHNADYLEISSDVPYVLGPDFMLVLFNVGGITATNAAFEKPPTSELDIVDPAVYLDHVHIDPLAAPALPDGAHRDGPADTFGAFETYMTLAGFMDRASRPVGGRRLGWGRRGRIHPRFDDVYEDQLDRAEPGTKRHAGRRVRHLGGRTAGAPSERDHNRTAHDREGL